MRNFNQITTTTIKNGVLTLPAQVRKPWQNRQVFLFVEQNRLIVQPADAAWDKYEEKLRLGKKKLTLDMVDKAVKWAKNKS
ncbi:MAG: hypothetical protein AAB525_02775 [Patescibacteria group bacterium]